MAKILFKNKKVLIMGLGMHGGGFGAVKFFLKQGAEVLVTDLKTEQQLQDSLKKIKALKGSQKIKYSLGGHREADFLWADLIVKNPDVPNSSPYLEVARKNNIEIETDLTLFFKLSKAFIIGVTGTKGKSTTASLIFHLLKSKYKKIFFAGNIGISPLEILPRIKKGGKVVLELSSFGLENLKQSPNIAVITNIMEDHLNRYGSMAGYINAKKIIFSRQKKTDILVLNSDDQTSEVFAKEAKSKAVYFSGDPKIRLDKLKIFGKHNLYNISAAVVVAKLLKIPKEAIEKSIKSFKGVESRQEFIAEVNGVKYFNDTTATMPEAAIAAIDAFSEKFPGERLIFICGGQNKGLNYDKLSYKIREKVSSLVMLPGNSHKKIMEGLEGYKSTYNASSMEEAVKKSAELAQPGNIVVLSPGAASFNLFKNEFDRGDQFVKIVKGLNEKTI